MDGGFNIVTKLLNITMLGTEWVLWLLILLSIISLGIVFERFIFFRTIKLNVQEFTEKLTKMLADKDYKGIQTLCESSPAIESQVILRGVQARDRGPKAMHEAMSGYLIGNRQNLDRGLMVLGTLGNNAPFIGLFGTVLGIIIAFHELAQNPAGGPSVVMTGISEALIATAVGLIVAIPAVIFYNYFQRVVKKHMSHAEAMVRLFLAHVSN